VRLLSELAEAQGVTPADPWAYVARKSAEAGTTAMRVNLAFFSSSCGDCGEIANIPVHRQLATRYVHPLLFNLVSGIYAPNAGSIRFAGRAIHGWPANRIGRAGIARTFQNIRLFAEMTALENVMVGRHVRTHSGLLGAIFRTGSFKSEEAAIAQRAQELGLRMDLQKDVTVIDPAQLPHAQEFQRSYR
jgi:hypothetical protein